MTSRENFLRMIEGEKPRWMPFDLPTTEPVAEAIVKATGRFPEEAFDTDFRTVDVAILGDNPEKWQASLTEKGFIYPPETVAGPYGISWVRPPRESLGTASHLLEMIHPLSVIEDIASLLDLPWPDTSNPASYASLSAQCAKIHAAGKVASGACECTIFEHTWYLRGMDNVFCDWAEENPVSDWLLDYFTERSVNKCRAFARAGCDVIRPGDDVGTQGSLLISKEMWRRNLKPRLKRVIDAIRGVSDGRKIWGHYHSDGEMTALVEELIDVGIDILNPVQPECMDIEKVASEFQSRTTFSGMIGTQITMPFGSPDDAREAVARCRRLHEGGSRVIVASTHVLEPDVTMDNIRAFIESVRAEL